MHWKFSERTHVAPSGTLLVADTVRRLKAQGVDLVDLGGGDPDFPTAPHVVEAAQAAMARGDTHYVDSAGVPALREAIAEKLLRENQVRVTRDEVLVTPGGKAAIFAVIQAFVEPGTEVLILEPAWVSYRAMVEAAGGTVRSLALSADQGFTVTRAALDAAITPATSVLIVNSPTNPTGRVLRAEELDAIAAVAREHELLVLSDEIYEQLVYPGHRHVSLATLPGLADRTLTVNGFSKAWAMTGWRLGYVAGPAALLAPVKVLHAHMVTCAASFTQAAGLAALRGPPDSKLEMIAAWERRGQTLSEALSALPGLRCPRPEGAFYAFLDVRGTGLDATTFTRRLLEEGRVAVTPGDAFGAAGAGHVRLSYATSDAELARAVERISSCLHRLT